MKYEIVAPCEPNGTAASQSQRIIEWLLVAFGVLAYLMLFPHAIEGDGGVRYSMLAQLVDAGHVAATKYSLVQPLIASPFYLAGKAFGNPLEVTEYFNTAVLFVTLGLIGLLARRHVDEDVLRRFLLLMLAGSMLTQYVENFYAEMLSAALMALAVLLFALDRAMLGTAAAALSVANAPAMILALGLLSLRRALCTRRWLVAFAPLIAAVVLIALGFWFQHGSPLRSGYEQDRGFVTVLPYSGRPTFSYPLLLGLLSECFSFGKGLLWFAPGLTLACIGSRRALSPLFERFWHDSVLVLVGLLLVYAKWWAWYGGFAWGPRFLVFAAFPASLMLAQHVTFPSRRGYPVVWLLGVLALSVWVAADGAVFGQHAMEVCRQQQYALEFLCWYTPEFSALVRPFIVPRALSNGEALLLVYFGLVAATLSRAVIAAYLRQARSAAVSTSA